MNPQAFEMGRADPEYPPQLLETPDPPVRLYGIGDPSALCLGLAIIGARKATPYGLSAAGLLAGWAGSCGYTVISGGAAGCDQAAHRACLDGGGKTVAVLAGGADVCYPSTAGALLERIARSGAVISEQPWGTRPLRWMFRRRNRIIAGLSAAVLVVEAGLPSGTFSTADDALAADREIMAVPGSVYSQASRGANRLISQGATIISEVEDLRLALERIIGPPSRQMTGWAPPSDLAQDPVLAAVSATPMRTDDLASALGIDVVTALRRLGTLEAAGVVVRYTDGRYGAAPGR